MGGFFLVREVRGIGEDVFGGVGDLFAGAGQAVETAVEGDPDDPGNVVQEFFGDINATLGFGTPTNRVQEPNPALSVLFGAPLLRALGIVNPEAAPQEDQDTDVRSGQEDLVVRDPRVLSRFNELLAQLETRTDRTFERVESFRFTSGEPREFTEEELARIASLLEQGPIFSALGPNPNTEVVV